MKYHSLPPLLISLVFLLSSAVVRHLDTPTPLESDSVLARIHFGDQLELDWLVMTLDIWEINPDQRYVLAYLEPAQYLDLNHQGFIVSIDEEKTAKVQSGIQLLPDQDAGIPGYPCYRTVEETFSSMEALAAEHPNITSWIDIGDSWKKWSSAGNQGYDLHTLVLTNKTIPGPKPRLYVMAAIHAREFTTAELASRFAEYLVENYNLDADITWLLDYFEVHVTPISNPDGRKFAEAGIYWRKNVNNTDGCENPNLWGTDLNRNSSFKWGLVGASQDACGETYHGSTPASEPETQAIQNYVSSIFADRRGPADSDPAPADTSGVFITLHSYGDLIFFPWAWTGEPAPNDAELQTLGRKFGFYSGYLVCQSGEPGCLYQSSGNSDDWAYGELGVPAYTFEIGTEFFESCSYFQEQVLTEQIPSLVYALKAARLPYQNPSGPESVNLALSAERIVPGAGLSLSFTADDTRYGSPGWGMEPSQDIAAARYSIDRPSWMSGVQTTDLQPGDGVFDNPIEEFSVKMDTADLALGRHTIYVESMDAGGNWGVPSAVFLWIAPVEYQPDIEPDTRYAISTPADEVIYNFQVINAGTQDDTLNIQVQGNSWPTSLSTSAVGPLFPGESAHFSVKVTIPESAQVGDQDLAILMAASQADPGRITHAQITTSTHTPLLFLPNITR